MLCLRDLFQCYHFSNIYYSSLHNKHYYQRIKLHAVDNVLFTLQVRRRNHFFCFLRTFVCHIQSPGEELGY